MSSDVSINSSHIGIIDFQLDRAQAFKILLAGISGRKTESRRPFEFLLDGRVEHDLVQRVSRIETYGQVVTRFTDLPVHFRGPDAAGRYRDEECFSHFFSRISSMLWDGL